MISAENRKRIAAANQLAEPIAYALTKAITGRGNELPPKTKHLTTIRNYWKSGNKTGKARESGERIRENILLAVGRYLHNSTLWHKGASAESKGDGIPDACALKSLFILHLIAEEQIQLDPIGKAAVMPMPAFGQRMETILQPVVCFEETLNTGTIAMASLIRRYGAFIVARIKLDQQNSEGAAVQEASPVALAASQSCLLKCSEELLSCSAAGVVASELASTILEHLYMDGAAIQDKIVKILQVRGAKVLSMEEVDVKALSRWTQEADSLADRLGLLGQCIGLQSSLDDNNGKPSKELVIAIEARIKKINDKVVEEQIKANLITDGNSTQGEVGAVANKEGTASISNAETVGADVAELLQIDSPVVPQDVLPGLSEVNSNDLISFDDTEVRSSTASSPSPTSGDPFVKSNSKDRGTMETQDVFKQLEQLNVQPTPGPSTGTLHKTPSQCKTEILGILDQEIAMNGHNGGLSGAPALLDSDPSTAPKSLLFEDVDGKEFLQEQRLKKIAEMCAEEEIRDFKKGKYPGSLEKHMENQAGLLVHTYQPVQATPTAAPQSVSKPYSLPLQGSSESQPQTSNMSFLEQQRAKIQSEAEAREREAKIRNEEKRLKELEYKNREEERRLEDLRNKQAKQIEQNRSDRIKEEAMKKAMEKEEKKMRKEAEKEAKKIAAERRRQAKLDAEQQRHLEKQIAREKRAKMNATAQQRSKSLHKTSSFHKDPSFVNSNEIDSDDSTSVTQEYSRRHSTMSSDQGEFTSRMEEASSPATEPAKVGLPLPGSWGSASISATKKGPQSNSYSQNSFTKSADTKANSLASHGSNQNTKGGGRSSSKSSKSGVARKSSCTVLYNFDAQDDQELTVSEGEEVEFVQAVDAGWALCQLENGSKTGLVPMSYLEIPEHLMRKHELAGA